MRSSFVESATCFSFVQVAEGEVCQQGCIIVHLRVWWHCVFDRSAVLLGCSLQEISKDGLTFRWPAPVVDSEYLLIDLVSSVAVWRIRFFSAGWAR
jgi:hypothetical protein